MKKFIAAISMAAVIFCCLPLTAAAERAAFSGAEEWEVLHRTNVERRVQANLPALSTFATLTEVAELRAAETVVLFDHTRPNGTKCFTAADEAGIDYTSSGENIAAGHRDAEEVVTAWMNSEGHRKNILTSHFKHMGVGYTVGNSEYGRHWAQFFIGGCTTTALANDRVAPRFDANGVLLNDPVLKVTCNLHGDCYLPLADTAYTYLGNDTYRVTYDGITATLPCSIGYPDVDYDLWYADGIRYVTAQGLMEGMPDGTFAPDKAMTRAEFVTILYRMDGATVSGDDGFTDVASGDWFYEQIKWAARTGLVNGMGDGTFAPNKPVTRAEMATILLRFHRRHNPGTPTLADISGFPDSADVQPWAKEAMQWAVTEGILSGSLDYATGRTLLLPQGNTTRAQIATVLMRYLSE